MFDDLPLNQKQKWFDIWIQHIKTVGKHSLSVIHMLTLIRNKFQPTLQHWQNDGSSNKNTYYFMFDDLSLNQKQKWFDIWIQHIKTEKTQCFKCYFFMPIATKKTHTGANVSY